MTRLNSRKSSEPRRRRVGFGRWCWGWWAAFFWGVSAGCGGSGGDARAVVVYCAQDQMFAEPIFQEFEKATGVRVRALYDSEAVKTVGLANRLIAEKSAPQCDVFWGNEELRTRQLAREGVFGSNRLEGESGPGWKKFGERRRVLVKRGDSPGTLTGLRELTNTAWRGRVSLAKPIFGSTATHWLVLRQRWGEAAWRDWNRALMANRPYLEEGNSKVIRRVASGEAWVGLTDSDDVRAGERQGLRVDVVEAVEDLLTLPNTLGAVRPLAPGSPAHRLIEYLTSEAVGRRLVELGALDAVVGSVKPALAVDWERVLDELPVAVREVEEIFRR